MTFTQNEIKVFNALIDVCMNEPEANLRELSDETGFSVDSVKGIVGSLVKKGFATSNFEVRDFNKKFVCINPIVDGEELSFGCDKYDDSEIEQFKLSELKINLEPIREIRKRYKSDYALAQGLGIYAKTLRSFIDRDALFDHDTGKFYPPSETVAKGKL